jgi:GNAT superfamily N-acetyltransferase
MNIREITEFNDAEFKAVKRFMEILSSDLPELTENLYKEVITSDNSHLFLIYNEDNIAGTLTIGFYKSPSGRKAWIEDVVVDENYRGKGLGKYIVQYAIEFSKKLGANTLMLTSSPKRIAANELYKSLDFILKETNTYRMQL